MAFNNVEYLKDTVHRYMNLMAKRGAVPVCNPDADPTDFKHLYWMLVQIKEDDTQSETKKNRWLGYIQGVLVCHNIVTVNEERELTRELFKGR